MRRFMNPMILVIFALLAISVINTGAFSSPGQWLITRVLILPGVIIGISFHEYAHAKAAYMLGDNTPYFQRRVTINPASHIDPIGFIALLFIGFGWGVPVQIDPGNFKKPRRDELIVSVAGVTMNLILAVIFAGILKLIVTLFPALLVGSFGGMVMDIFMYIIQINLVLMIFNLLPVPPLDGFNIISELFNLKQTDLYYKVYENGFMILLLLILFGVVDGILSPLVNLLYSGILGVFF